MAIDIKKTLNDLRLEKNGLVEQSITLAAEDKLDEAKQVKDKITGLCDKITFYEEMLAQSEEDAVAALAGRVG